MHLVSKAHSLMGLRIFSRLDGHFRPMHHTLGCKIQMISSAFGTRTPPTFGWSNVAGDTIQGSMTRSEQLEVNFCNSATPRLSTTMQFLSFHHVQISPPEFGAPSRFSATEGLMGIRSSPQSAYHLCPPPSCTTRPIFGPTRPLNSSIVQTLKFYQFPSKTWNEVPVPG